MREILATVSAGIFGAVGPGLLTWACGPLFRSRGHPPSCTPFSTLLVLIPAHNEGRTISQTIHSVLTATRAAGVNARVLVGADACSDDTAAAAKAAGAEVTEVPFRSKWRTLSLLAAAGKQGEWLALVDAGAIWPGELIADIRDLLDDPKIIGVAPAYFPAGASVLERALWRVEAFWKLGENRAGGPISVHGATVLYRAEVLGAALAYLESFGRESWLNDDVVIPFAARLLHPGRSLVYWCPPDIGRRISDGGIAEEAPQAGRRARMVAGNLEWALTLFPAALRSSPSLALVALRRLLRIFWAYWAMMLAYGFFLAVLGTRDRALLACLVGAIVMGLVLAGAGKRGILDAAIASAAAPFLVVSVLRGRARAWG